MPLPERLDELGCVPAVPAAEPLSQDDPPADELGERDADGPVEPIGPAEIVTALADAAAAGRTLAELEVGLGCVRSRIRRLLRELEASHVVRREGASRSTRYRLAVPADPREDGAPEAEHRSARSLPIRRRRSSDHGDATRTLYYRPHAGADPQKIAAIVLQQDSVAIEYAQGQRPFDALERIVTPAGVVTPRDGLRFWVALEKAFSTSSHFFVS